MDRSERTTKEREVELGQRDEKVGANGSLRALKEKMRRRETSKTNCAMLRFIIFKSAGSTCG